MGTEMGTKNGKARRMFYKKFPITCPMNPCTGSVKIRNKIFGIN